MPITTHSGHKRPAASRALATLAWALVVFIAILGIARIHYHGQTLARGPDQADMLLAFFNEASHAIAEEGPLAAMYTERVRAGESNWSNPNYHMLYPLYFNWAGADASPEATLDRLNAIIVLHLALLGAGTFTLARALGVRVAPAIIVALAIPWFPAVRAGAGWPHIIAAMAWLPWVLAAQVHLYRGAGWRRQAPAAALLALAAILLVHAHPAQNLVFAAWASGGTWLLLGLQLALARDAAGGRAFAASSAWIAAAAVATLAACWPYLAEIIAFHDRSIRWLGEVGGHLVGNQPVPLEALRHHALPLSDAGMLVAFEARRGVGHAYVGAAVLVAALCVLLPQGPVTTAVRCARAMLACGVFALASCFAVMAPLLAQLPLVNRVRELVWWSAPAVVLLLPVAAAGLQRLRGRTLPAPLRDGLLWLAVAAVAIAMGAILASGTSFRGGALLALLASCAGLAWCMRAGRIGQAALAAACALVFFGSAWAPFRHNIRFPYDDAMLFHADRVQARADAAALAARLDGLDRYRFMLGPSLDNAQLLTHAWTLYGFRSIHGGIGPTEYDKHRLLSSAGPTVAALYGVRWSLWPETQARPGDERLREGLVLRTHPQAVPRLSFLGGGLELAEDPVAHLLALGDASPLRAVVRPSELPAGIDPAAYAGPGRTGGAVTLLRNARTVLEASVDVHEPGLLLLNEDPAARWRATVDGRPVPVFRANGFQAALAITSPGRHVVRIERPARLSGGTR